MGRARARAAGGAAGRVQARAGGAAGRAQAERGKAGREAGSQRIGRGQARAAGGAAGRVQARAGMSGRCSGESARGTCVGGAVGSRCAREGGQPGQPCREGASRRRGGRAQARAPCRLGIGRTGKPGSKRQGPGGGCIRGRTRYYNKCKYVTQFGGPMIYCTPVYGSNRHGNGGAGCVAQTQLGHGNGQKLQPKKPLDHGGLFHKASLLDFEALLPPHGLL
ncbi:hypothetical protein B0H14DRAFT_2608617 [Mycena olivaceomarginata]|nr:hypothetical protein B0H14DRAFT_2608617 [Mycena olivaceomarginata]